MKKSVNYISLLVVLSTLLSILLKISTAIDIMNTTQILRDGETLVSSEGTFELGFFSSGISENRYVGIWYKKIPVMSVVWVANRETPLRSKSGILKIIEPGLLVLVNDTNHIVWSSNTSRVAKNPVVKLFDTGNLVLREAINDRGQNFIWQSFDYLSDSLLPSMNLGWNYATGLESYLSAWKTNEDPAPGDFTLHLESNGYPQTLVKKGDRTLYRLGTWNGLRFSGIVSAIHYGFTYGLVIMNENKTYYRDDSINVDGSIISRTTLNHQGIVQTLVWNDRGQNWVLYINFPADQCDVYQLCGTYSTCKIENSPPCECLHGFVPRYPQSWMNGNWSNGCIRRTPLNCEKGDVFLKYSGVKIPDSRHSWFNNDRMTLEECEVECLKNCSCTAYSQLDISLANSGCLFWTGDLTDMRNLLSSDGQDIYIRMTSADQSNSKGKTKRIIISSLTSLMGVVLVGLSSMLYYWRRKKGYVNGGIGGSNDKDFELPLFGLSTISKATNNFSVDNKLGQGGYGPVYKGILEEGQYIAVKRLSKTSMQGLDEFKNEIICIAKLQHRNLVKLLGCCIQGDEKMLIYEYMPNKSLDFFLFDQTKSMLLDWPKRLQVVNGVARGLLYIHQDSRLRIIHRDLKASNILLDTDMNPKISDFGIARSFRENETEDKTSRVVGTYGYMSPEYAMHGRYSIKSDVFSFGVLLLEIASGKRNSGFSYGDQQLNLLGHAWTLYKEERSLELVDAYLRETANSSEVLRLIHLGLLCVQQCPDNRPSMASVVALLSNEVELPQAKQPGFFTEGDAIVAEPTTSCLSNKLTITELEAR